MLFLFSLPIQSKRIIIGTILEFLNNILHISFCNFNSNRLRLQFSLLGYTPKKKNEILLYHICLLYL